MDSGLATVKADGHRAILGIALGVWITTGGVVHAIHVVVLGALPFGHWTMIHNWRLLPHDIAAPRRAVLRQVIRMYPRFAAL